MAKRGEIIDGEFEIVSGFRPGDPHPDKPRTYWTGLTDRTGEPLWWIEPRFNRWQFAGLVVLGLLGGGTALVLALSLALATFNYATAGRFVLELEPPQSPALDPAQAKAARDELNRRRATYN